MKNPERRKPQGEGERIGWMGGAGAVGGALDRFINGHGPKNSLAHGARYGVESAAAQALGDMLMGQPEEHGFMDEAKRGAAGGSIVGAASGALNTGMAQKGMNLVHFLMQRGIGKKAAIAMILGGGAALGAGTGALSHGLGAGLINYRPEEK
jgi:hypothetical protein